MFASLRILPVLIISLIMVLGFNLVELWGGLNAAGSARAASKAEQSEKDAHVPGLDAHEEPEMLDEHAENADDAHAAPASPRQERPRIPGEEDFISPAEIDVLQSLNERRQALEKRQAELDMREKLLVATERRLDEKLAEVKRIEAEIKSAINMLDEREMAQITSLVKVYETMKPKDAASILQELDKTILIEVAARMKEQKMAAILAAMDPKKAREVTVLLAQRNELPVNGG